MKLLKMELHDPYFDLCDIVRRESGDDELYDEKVESYWYSRRRLMGNGAYPTASEMLWQG